MVMTVEQIKPFVQPDGDYTRLHNALFDVVMPTMKPNAWKLLCFILRKTNGWNKTEAQLSYNQLRAGTGIQSDATLSATIKELADARYIIVTPIQWQSSLYELNYQYIVTTTSQPTTKEEPVQPTSKTAPTSKIEDAIEIEDALETVVLPTTEIEVPPTTEIEDIKRNIFKEKEKERECAQDESPQPATPSPLPLSAPSSANGFDTLLDEARKNANGTYGRRREQSHIDGLKKKLDKFGIDQDQFRAMVDSHLLAKGTKELADGDTEAADRELRKAQQFVVDLCGIGKRFWVPDGVNLVWDSWTRNDWRTNPSEQQLLEHASQMVAGKVAAPKVQANGQAQPSQLRKMKILS